MTRIHRLPASTRTRRDHVGPPLDADHLQEEQETIRHDDSVAALGIAASAGLEPGGLNAELKCCPSFGRLPREQTKKHCRNALPRDLRETDLCLQDLC